MKIFGNLFKISFLAMILAEGISLAGVFWSPFSVGGFFVILGLALGLSLYKMEYGVFFLLAELFFGGKGHLFSLDFGGLALSLRMGLFLVVLGIGIYKIAMNNELRTKNIKYLVQSSEFRVQGIVYFLIIVSVLGSVINGLIHNEFSSVFFDANAWLFFLLLPVFWLAIKSEKEILAILQILAAAVSWLAIKTILILFLFSRQILVLHDWFYNWLRDSTAWEITPLAGNLFRVFSPSQIYVLIGFFIFLTILVLNSRNLNKFSRYFSAILITLSMATLLISQSRSFWVGGVVAYGLWLIACSWFLKGGWKRGFYLTIILIILILLELNLISLITGAGVNQRVENLAEEAAISSRMNQLPVLGRGILKNPILGSGFGAPLTYQSADPRILKSSPGGWYVTSAFEWGYLDIALKLGIIGLLIYFALIFQVFYLGIQKSKLKNQNDNSKFKIINFGFLTGLAALLIVNIFSPYLNHPLGIGYVMLLTVIFSRS